MGELISSTKLQTRIALADCQVRLFIKYKGNYCSEIRIWKLPLKAGIFSMFNTKNLYWAIYGDNAKVLQGWLYKEGSIQEVLTNKLLACSNSADLKDLCVSLEEIMNMDMESIISREVDAHEEPLV